MTKYVHISIVTDCGKSDKARYEIAAGMCIAPFSFTLSFFETESMNTLHSGFTAAAHALSTITHFGAPFDGQGVGILVNAAPRHGTENGRKLRGQDRKTQGEDIYALRLTNGIWVVGPNAGLNLYFFSGMISESFVVTDTSGQETPFRSMEIMVPTLAKVLGVRDFPNIRLTPQPLKVECPTGGIYVADWDSHGNIYLFSNLPEAEWVPPLGETVVFRIGNKIVRLRHVDGIFAGNTGEETLTKGSLKLGGRPIYYIVIVGGDMHSVVGNPSVGTRVEIERE